MKLNFRVWISNAPQKTEFEWYTRFPLDMLRYDPAYIHQTQFKQIQEDYARGGRRKAGETYALVYVQVPGYRTSVMSPTKDRYHSFNWTGPFRRLDRKLEAEYFTPPKDHAKPSEWLTVIGCNQGNLLTVTLQDWIDTPNMTKWADRIWQIKRSTLTSITPFE